MPELRRNRAEDEAARDILAAEAFAVPSADPSLRHHLVLPEDPAGIPEPHDILAAEEFAMPAPDPAASSGSRSARAARARMTGLAGAGLFVVWLRRRRR